MAMCAEDDVSPDARYCDKALPRRFSDLVQMTGIPARPMAVKAARAQGPA
jgi:hypothetical protein